MNKILIGNKSDMPQREISTEEGAKVYFVVYFNIFHPFVKKLAEEYGIPFYETSAKENVNVDKVFSLF